MYARPLVGSIIRLVNPKRTAIIGTILIEPNESIMFIRAYLRASTDAQDAQRARKQLEEFAEERKQYVAAWYIENESGATLKRPELFRLLSDSRPGDILLIEQVDRLSRLNGNDWETLKAEIQTRRIRVVALDLPTSHQLATAGDDFTGRMLDALNGMMLDMLAAIARKDYEDRRRRAAQGIEKAKAAGKYRGRKPDEKRQHEILAMLDKGLSWSFVCSATGASRSTLSRLTKSRETTE
jgi:DNA invertase Pin-like site-specific DNA recombinase